MDSMVVKRHCFLEEDDGLASLADMEAGFSGNYNDNNKQRCNSICHSTQICSPRGGFRNRSTWSPRFGAAGRFYDPRFEEERNHPHFLTACFSCKKQLGNNRDIFMYRGDTAFCSEECRQEQIDLDESKEKNRNLSSSVKALRKKQQDQNMKPNSPNRDYNSFHSGAVAAA